MCMTRAQKKIIYKLDNVINKEIIFPDATLQEKFVFYHVTIIIRFCVQT